MMTIVLYSSNGNRDTGIFNFVAVFVKHSGLNTQETQYIVSGYTSQAETSLGNTFAGRYGVVH
ncbi:hypothetical protein N5V81_14100 [Escherichia coli]|nr:hypothetical protein [Escherichia coli]